MARIRTIKPEFWEDESVGTLSHPARLLFLGSLNLADDEGLLRWNEMYISSSIFPYDKVRPITVKSWMAELVDNDFIFSYKSGKIDQQIAYIVTFHKHQRIDKPQPAKFPPPKQSDIRFRNCIAKRDNWKCHICGGLIDPSDSIRKVGSLALSLDHVKPTSRGGSDYPSNLKASHLSCNHSKAGSYNEPQNHSENDSTNESGNDSTTEGKGREGNGRERRDAHAGLVDSNLFRKPVIPTLESVREIFLRNGGTDEMADKFFLKYDALGWFLGNSPVQNFASLVPSFINNFHRNSRVEVSKKNKNSFI